MTRSMARWLTVAVVAVLVYSIGRGCSGGSDGNAPASQHPAAATSSTAAAPGITPGTAPAVAPNAAAPALASAGAQAGNPRAVAPPSLAAISGARSAAFGASTIDVIVKSNDTLDGIFRRLKLSLTDLATLRGLPGLKALQPP
jgi:Flp pilus assembly secretin CpaC